MATSTKRVFTQEYRAQAVKQVLEQGKGVAQAARDLDISIKTYANWVKQAKAGKLGQVDTHRVIPVGDLQAQVSRLQQELAQAREDRDILKKATAYFAKQSK